MPSVSVDREPIYLFEIDDRYYFSHYFDRTDIFEHLSEYYNDEKYRFEVPTSEFDAVSDYLGEQWFEPVIVDDIASFCVVKEQYTNHAEILKRSVIHWSRRGFNFFVMKDPVAVDRAVELGATRIGDTDLVVGL